MVNLTIDGKSVAAPKGTNVLEAAKLVGISVPNFCYHRDLSWEGSCRMCLVAIEGRPKLVPSCCEEVKDGMVVQFERPDARELGAALDRDQAHAAAALPGQVPVVAEVRHADADQLRRLEHVRALRRGDGLAVDRQVHHGRVAQRSSSPAMMLRVPRIATKSATIWPRSISSLAANV